MARFAVVTVSFNTRELTSLLLWSLRRVLQPSDLDIVIVDNASTDGSTQLLTAVAEAELCHLVVSSENVGHGPALNVALETAVARSAERVWILDSDCVVARSDALQVALAAHPGAAIIGESHWDRWHKCDRLETYSLLVDQQVFARDDIALFEPGGDPSFEFLASAERAGLVLTSFPFTKDGYLVHRGRSSLVHVMASGDESHPLYEWAVSHHQPHYGAVDGAAGVHAQLLDRFRAQLATSGSLVDLLRP